MHVIVLYKAPSVIVYKYMDFINVMAHNLIIDEEYSLRVYKYIYIC